MLTLSCLNLRLEQVDYLFIQKGLAGLRKDFDVAPEDLEQYAVEEEKVDDDKKETALDKESMDH